MQHFVIDHKRNKIVRKKGIVEHTMNFDKTQACAILAKSDPGAPSFLSFFAIPCDGKVQLIAKILRIDRVVE